MTSNFKSGAQMINDERDRQIIGENFTSDHDRQFEGGQLVNAAFTYLVAKDLMINSGTKWGSVLIRADRRQFWPWDLKTFKPTPDDRIRELVKAGALIAAEIDRIGRSNYEKDIKI